MVYLLFEKGKKHLRVPYRLTSKTNRWNGQRDAFLVIHRATRLPPQGGGRGHRG